MRSENNYYNLISDNIEKMIYEGSSFPHAIDELSYHNANTLKYKDVLELYHEFYRPNNMVLSIVSHMSLSYFIRVLKTSFFVKVLLLHVLTIIHGNTKYTIALVRKYLQNTISFKKQEQ
jgi:hypothetical protein